MPLSITRRTTFCAAHRLHNPELTEEENHRVFGNCNYLHGHGHNYTLEVTITGEADPKTGMIINLSELDEIIQQEIIVHCDHHHFNFDVPMMKGMIPTIENMVVVFWNLIEKRLPDGVRMAKIHLWETENNSATYTGPGQ